MRKLTIAFLAIIIGSVILVSPACASGVATVSVDPTTQNFPSAHVGDTIHVNIVVSKVPKLWGWDIVDLTFNPKILNITGVTEGPFLSKAGQTLFIWDSESLRQLSQGDIPEIQDVLLSTNTASGSGVIATLAFTVLSLGTSQIAFKHTELDSNAPTINYTDNQPISTIIPSTGVDAIVVVGNSQPTPSASALTTSPNPTADASPGSSPNPSSGTSQAPEFPNLVILVPLLGIVTLFTLLIIRKGKTYQKPKNTSSSLFLV